MADDAQQSAESVGRAPRFGWIDGILTGPRAEGGQLANALRRLSRLGLGEVDVSADGGRFVVMFEDRTFVGSELSHDRIEDLVEALRAVVEATEARGEVESSLRCTEVFEDETRETLFLAESGTIRALSRTRERTPDDLRREPTRPVVSADSIGWGRLAFVGILLCLVFAFLAWRSGWIDAVFAHPIDDIAVDSGPFGDTLQVDVSSEWGRYVVKITRGPQYPATNADLERLSASAASPAERASVNAVANGESVWVRVTGDGEEPPLAAARVELRALLERDDAAVEARLPGRISARRIELALSSGREDG